MNTPQLWRHMAFGLMLLMALPGKAFDQKDYKAYAEEMRKTVWAQDGLPEFKNYKCPAKYKNESAVILAAYDELLLDQKSKLKTFALNFYTIKQLNYNRLNRQLIYINDEASLKKFSEFDYKTFSKVHNTGIGDDIERNVLGVRVIKPNGTIKEVSTDDYVTVNEGKKDKDKSEKLAVPGLEVGDVLDVFTSEMKQIREENIDPVAISYMNDYPTLSYRIHCSIDPQLTIQYRTLNGAPDFKQSTDEDGNIVLDAIATNLDRTTPDLWYDDATQTPMVLLYIQGRKIPGYVPESVKKKGLQANPDAKLIQKDDWSAWALVDKLYKLGPIERNIVKEALKTYKDPTAQTDYIYNHYTMMRMAWPKDYRNMFIPHLAQMLQKAKIPYECGITTSVGNEPIDQLISFRNTEYFLRLADGRLLTYPRGPVAPGTVDADLQGRKAIVCTDQKKHMNSDMVENFTIPVSKAEDNRCLSTVKATIDGTLMNIDRTMSLTGTQKEGLNMQLSNGYDQVGVFILPTDTKYKTVEDVFKSEKADHQKERFQRQREAQQDNFKQEIADYADSKPVSVGECKMLSMGNKSINDAFVYETNYTMDGYVKKAGPNLIVSVGKLIGSQLTVEGKDRKRSADIHRSAPITIEHDIYLTIPNGYQVSAESLAQLNTSVSNDCATFKAKAGTEGNQLHLHVTKIYQHQQEPVANWNKLLQVVDAAANYTQKQVMLRRK